MEAAHFTTTRLSTTRCSTWRASCISQCTLWAAADPCLRVLGDLEAKFAKSQQLVSNQEEPVVEDAQVPLRQAFLLDTARAFPPEAARVCAHLPVLGNPAFFRMVFVFFFKLLKCVDVWPVCPCLALSLLSSVRRVLPDILPLCVRA